jgi:hypothetical protein
MVATLPCSSVKHSSYKNKKLLVGSLARTKDYTGLPESSTGPLYRKFLSPPESNFQASKNYEIYQACRCMSKKIRA